MRTFKKLSAAFSLAAAMSGVSAAPAHAASVSIDFEDVDAPCVFVETSPLTDMYKAKGVTFGGIGGAPSASILDFCSNFGIKARSGINFLAVNTNFNAAVQRLTFANDVTDFSIFAGTGTGANFTATFFDRNNQLLGISSVLGQGEYALLSRAERFSYVEITSDVATWVMDDLTFKPVAAIPEPASWAMMIVGFGSIGAAARRRQRTTASFA